jgi:hypothetical protein
MAEDEIIEHEPGSDDYNDERASEGRSRTRRRRRQRPFPASSFNQASELAEAMLEIGGGSREVRRVTLFDHLGRSPESGPSRHR